MTSAHGMHRFVPWMSQTKVDVSVLVPFGDAEDWIGALVKETSEELAGQRFEILCIDEDSGDNSHALLALLRKSYPELKVIGASRGKGLKSGIEHARGDVVWVRTGPSTKEFAGARERLADSQDVVVLDEFSAVCRRTRVAPLFAKLKTKPPVIAQLAAAARSRGLRVFGGHDMMPVTGSQRAISRILGGISILGF